MEVECSSVPHAVHAKAYTPFSMVKARMDVEREYIELKSALNSQRMQLEVGRESQGRKKVPG